ncbi:MAG TPA: hypothetical protein VFS37_05905 [Conexibacter sp.]|nr:hypothetical protein [Conexibacter sp.]
MENVMSADATTAAVIDEIAAARDALIDCAQREPDKWWEAFELKTAARNGWSAGAMGLALGELLDDGVFELDADQRVRARR